MKFREDEFLIRGIVDEDIDQGLGPDHRGRQDKNEPKSQSFHLGLFT